ncbi:MAG: fabF1 [candidate division NC10 bacterium]|nr:fabF1 [candidate division NC10 bacterium]
MEACEQAMAMALKEADCLPKDLSFICPHGNGTRKGDRSELTAITRLLGSDRASVVVCGLKPYTGHMGAASDIAEIALGLTALKNGLVPATLNFEKAEGGFEELQVVGDHRQVTGTRFLSLSQGFGGQSLAVVVSL